MPRRPGASRLAREGIPGAVPEAAFWAHTSLGEMRVRVVSGATKAATTGTTLRFGDTVASVASVTTGRPGAAHRIPGRTASGSLGGQRPIYCSAEPAESLGEQR